MKNRFGTKNEPKNSGTNYYYSLKFAESSRRLDGVVDVSMENSQIHFDKRNVIFSLIENLDIISVVAKDAITLNSKPITKGQMYILEEGDVVETNGVEFVLERLEEKALGLNEGPSKSLPPEALPPVPVKKVSTKSAPRLDALTVEKPKVSIKKVIESKEEQAPAKEERVRSLNSLVRFFAVVVEILIVLIILEFIEIDKEYLDLVRFKGMDSFLEKMNADMSLIYSSASFGIIFIGLRVVGALIFGVSVGQFLLGAFSSIGLLSKRLLGVLREIIGLITGSLIIFDLPSLIGRRTLKEVLSGTNIQGSSFLKTFFLILITTSILAVSYPLIPFFSRDMEFRPVEVKQMIQRKKSKDNSSLPPHTLLSSKFFNMSISPELNPLPFFRVKKKIGKLLYRPELKFLTKNKASLSFEKKLDLKKVLSLVKKENQFLQISHPTLFVTLLNDSKMGKELQNKLNQKSITNELYSFTRASYQLNLESYIDHLFEYGPIVKGFIDYRALMDKNMDNIFSSIDFTNLAQRSYIKFNYSKRTASLLNISKDDGQGRVLKLKYRKYREFSRGIHSPLASHNQSSVVSLVDLLNFKNEILNFERAFQISFNYLKQALQLEDDTHKEEVLASFESQINYLNRIGSSKSNKRNDKELVDKYVQNLSDVVRAYKEGDKAYFGLDELVSLKEEI